MTRRGIIRGVAFAVLFVVGPSSKYVWAQIKTGFEADFYLGGSFVQGGIVKVLDYWEERYIESTIAKSGIVAGVKGVVHLGSRFGLEMAFGASTNRYRANLYHLGESRAETNSAILGFMSMNGLGYLATGKFAPYVTAGIGCVAFSEKAVFGFNFGGGFKVFLNPRWALDVDLRYYPAVFENTLEEWGSLYTVFGWEYGMVKEPYTDRINPFQVSVGFCYFFGRTKGW